MAVVSDLMRVAREIRSGSPERVSPFAHERLGEYKPISDHAADSAPITCVSAWRTGPGIIAKLAGILASKHISLEAVLQEPCDNRHDLPFVITVEPTSEQSIREAIAEMSTHRFPAGAAAGPAHGDCVMKRTAYPAASAVALLARRSPAKPTPATRPRKAATSRRSRPGRSGARRSARSPRELVDAMGAQTGMTVADVGTGVGYMLPFLSRGRGRYRAR